MDIITDTKPSNILSPYLFSTYAFAAILCVSNTRGTMDQYQRQDPQEETPLNQPPSPDEPIVTEADVVPQSDPTTDTPQTTEPAVEPAAETEPLTESQPAEPAYSTENQPATNAPIVSPTGPKSAVTDTPASATTAPVNPVGHEPRTFLAAFLLTLFFGYYGLNQVYLGNKTQGWVRFALGIAAFPLSIVFIGFIIMAVLGVWAIVDFFKIYLGKRVDGNGTPLTTNSRDSGWAKVFFIVTLAGTAINVILVVIGIASGAFVDIQNKAMIDDNRYYYNDYTYRIGEDAPF